MLEPLIEFAIRQAATGGFASPITPIDDEGVSEAYIPIARPSGPRQDRKMAEMAGVCDRPGDCNCYDPIIHKMGIHRTDCDFADDTNGPCDYLGCTNPRADYAGARYVCARHINWSRAHRGGGPIGTVHPLDDWLHPEHGTLAPA